MKFLAAIFVALFALAPVPAWSLGPDAGFGWWAGPFGVVASAGGFMADV